MGGGKNAAARGTSGNHKTREKNNVKNEGKNKRVALAQSRFARIPGEEGTLVRVRWGGTKMLGRLSTGSKTSNLSKPTAWGGEQTLGHK